MSSSRERRIFSVLIIFFVFALFSNFCFAQISSRNKQISRNLTKRGILALKERKFNDAQKLFISAIRYDSTYDVPHYYLGNFYNDYMNKDKAIEHYKTAVSLNPKNYVYHLKLGKVYLDKNEYNKALDNFLKAKKLKPSNAGVYYNLGVTYKKKNDLKKAKNNLKALLEIIDKDHEKIKRNKSLAKIYWAAKAELAQIAAKNKNYKEAKRYYEEILRDNTVDEGLNTSVKSALESINLRSSQSVLQFILIGFGILILGMFLFWKFYLLPLKKSSGKPEPPSSAFAAKDYPSLANFAAQHLRMFTKMDKSLFYFVRRKKNPLMLARAENLRREDFEELLVDWKELRNWIEFIGTKPFIYEKQRKEIPFLRTFPRAKEKLEAASPRIGVPFIYDDELRGLAFMCYPGLTGKEKVKLKNRFIKNISNIRKVASDVAQAADKIYRKEMAIADTITPAYNQFFFKEKLKDEVDYCRQKEQPLVLIMFECEGMSAILNRFGEERKNYVLNTTIQALQVKLGTDNVSMFRIGDYRFAIILHNIGILEGKDIALIIMDTVSKLEFTTPIPNITISMGVAVYPEHSEDAEQLSTTARNALGKAMSSGRSNLVIGSEDIENFEVSFANSMKENGELDSKETEPTEDLKEMPKEEKRDLEDSYLSPSGNLVMPKNAKTPISIAPPPAADNKKKKKPSSPFFRSAAKSSPSTFAKGKEQNVIRKSKKISRASQTAALTSFEDLWKNPDEEKEEPKSNFRLVSNDYHKRHNIQKRSPKTDISSRRLTPKSSPATKETSLLRKVSMRESGQATSKLPPLPKSGETKKTMSSLIIRRSRSSQSMTSSKPQMSEASTRRLTTAGLKSNRPMKSNEKVNSPIKSSTISPSQTSNDSKVKEAKSFSFRDTSNKAQKKIPKKTEPKVVKADTKDEITNFYTKAFFEKNIGRYIVRAKKVNRPISLLFLKLDRQKEFAAKLGKPAVDKILRQITHLTRSNLRNGVDFPARYSEEIFVVIIPDKGQKETLEISEKIRNSVSKHNLSNIPGKITLSMGISTFPTISKTPKDLMKNSYHSLVFATKKGGNQTMTWDIKYNK